MAMEYDAYFPLAHDIPVLKPALSKWFFGKLMPSLSVRGTTYSGHPTRTTLGNTLRSINYYSYLMELIGIEPKLIAAGDDVCCFVENDRVPDFLRTVWQYTHNVNEVIQKGLGQIVKDVFVTPWWKIDFCSKHAVHVGNTETYDGWYLTREPKKALTTRNYVPKQHPLFKDRGYLYNEAISYSIKTELPIPFFEDVANLRC